MLTKALCYVFLTQHTFCDIIFITLFTTSGFITAFPKVNAIINAAQIFRLTCKIVRPKALYVVYFYRVTSVLVCESSVCKDREAMRIVESCRTTRCIFCGTTSYDALQDFIE